MTGATSRRPGGQAIRLVVQEAVRIASVVHAPAVTLEAGGVLATV